MLVDCLVAVVVSVLESFFDIEHRERILSLQVQDPCVCVEIGRVVRFLLNGSLAHLLGFLQVSAVDGQCPSVVVEDAEVVRRQLKRLFECGVCLFVVFLLAEQERVGGQDLQPQDRFVCMEQGVL